MNMFGSFLPSRGRYATTEFTRVEGADIVMKSSSSVIQLLHSKGTSSASSPVWDRFLAEDSMNILAAIKREERKLDIQLGKLQRQLEAVRAAANAMGNSACRGLSRLTERVLSEAG